MATTTTELKELLGADVLSLRKGIYTYRKEFFYTHGQTAESHAQKIKALLPQAQILDQEEIWKPFRGGASTAQSSHFKVTFTLDGSS